MTSSPQTAQEQVLQLIIKKKNIFLVLLKGSLTSAWLFENVSALWMCLYMVALRAQFTAA